VINFDKRQAKFPVKSKRKPAVCLGLCSGYCLRLCLGLHFLLRVELGFPDIRETLHDLYCLFISPEMLVKCSRMQRGYFVMLIAIGMHAVECNPGHMCRPQSFRLFSVPSLALQILLQKILLS